jgi:Rps23 Pro-64 3,4-dihydroxylase Tpa1-like proline 4-hydroxylase
VTRHGWWLVCDEFLAPSEAELVLESALEGAHAYEPSAVMQGDADYRRSNVRYYEPRSMALLQTRLTASAEAICERLRIAPFGVRQLELQLSCSGHGDYYRPHSDNHNERLRSRRVTCVYYVHREPKAFRGGELRIHAPGSAQPRFADVEPQHNRLVAFESSLQHEVRPVVLQPDRFADRRFAMNAWLHA